MAIGFQTGRAASTVLHQCAVDAELRVRVLDGLGICSTRACRHLILATPGILRPVVGVCGGAAVHAPSYLTASEISQRSVFACAVQLCCAVGQIVAVDSHRFIAAEHHGSKRYMVVGSVGKAVLHVTAGRNTKRTTLIVCFDRTGVVAKLHADASVTINACRNGLACDGTRVAAAFYPAAII